MRLIKRHIKFSLLLVMLLLTLVVKAQQDPMFTQYMNNPVVINPAYAGSSGNFNLGGIFRKQWTGTGDWSPTTNSISVNSPFFDYKVGLGFTFINDNVYPVEQNGVYVDYAYHLQFDRGNNLSLGLKAGFNHFRKDLLSLDSYEADSWVFENGLSSKFLPNFGVGAYFYKPNKYFLGLSIPKLLRNSFADDEDNNDAVAREEIHYYFTGGFVKTVDAVIKVKPSFMIRHVSGAPISIELSTTAIFYDRLWTGLSYRLGDAISGHVRMQLNDQMQLGYSYDLTNSRLRNYNNGTHEVFISYSFSFRQKRVLSPRYF